MTRIYAAPLEGLTGFVWRKAHNEIFGGVDKYYTPFISPSSNYEFQTKELRDLTQNESNLVPQIIANKSEMFIWAAEAMRDMGYDELNFNLGCPSGTVVSKAKGSGALRDLSQLDRMLDEIYTALPDMKISLKTRIGINSPDEWPAIQEVFERYPVHELIVHPRIRKEMYKGKADRAMFEQLLGIREAGDTQPAAEAAQPSTAAAATAQPSTAAQPDTPVIHKTHLPLVYNGDVTKADDPAFFYPCPVMLGRGLIADPALARTVKGGEPATREELIRFHDLQLEGYKSYMSGDLPVLHRMKEFWTYFASNFDASDAQMKKLYKAKKLSEYEHYAASIMG